MDNWFYLLLFIFSTITTLSLVYRFIANLTSDIPERILLTDKEKLLYCMVMSYTITYLIYI